MSTEQTKDRLSALRLYSMRKTFSEHVEGGNLHKLEAAELVAMMVDREYLSREQGRYERSRKRANFKVAATLSDIRFEAKRGLAKSQLTPFLTHEWVKQRRNVFISGPTGVGKTFLACAIGEEALRNGVGVLYMRASVLLAKLSQHKAQGDYLTFRESIAKVSVLVLDDFGVPPFTMEETREMLELIEDRHGLGSTIVSTQLPKDKVHACFADPTLSDAICDRVLSGAICLPLKGESMRK
jgi:DNA replication protein DnaC